MAERRFQILEIGAEERAALLDRIRPGQPISEDDYRILRGLVTGVTELVALIEPVTDPTVYRNVFARIGDAVFVRTKTK